MIVEQAYPWTDQYADSIPMFSGATAFTEFMMYQRL